MRSHNVLLGVELEGRMRIRASVFSSFLADAHFEVLMPALQYEQCFLQHHGFRCIPLYSEVVPSCWLLEAIVLPYMGGQQRQFWEQATRNVLAWKQEIDDDREVVLTGHSLGGGIAQVIAARLGLRALVFSSPGILYSAKKFGIYNRTFWLNFNTRDGPTSSSDKKILAAHPSDWHGIENAKRLITIVMPDYDQVPLVDEQLGQRQRIECRLCDEGKNGICTQSSRPSTVFRSLGNAGVCHTLNKTACELWRVCGDKYNRSWACDSYVSRADIGREFNPDDPS